MHLRFDAAPAVVSTPSLPQGAAEIPGCPRGLIARHGSSGDGIPGLAYSTGVVLRHMRDLLIQGRGTRSVLGNALAARLGKTVHDLSMPIYYEYETAFSDLVRDASGRVTAVEVRMPGGVRTIRTQRGVVQAGGGFPQNEATGRAEMPHARRGHYSMSPEGNSGDGFRIAEKNGAHRGTESLNPAFWAPVSRLKRAYGTMTSFPHLFVDRAKPGLIAVDGEGSRFVNESASYDDFVSARIGRLARGETRSWLIADHRFLRKYGQAKYFAVKLGIAALSKAIALALEPWNETSTCIEPFAWSRMICAIGGPAPGRIQDHGLDLPSEILGHVTLGDVAFMEVTGASRPVCLVGQLINEMRNPMALKMWQRTEEEILQTSGSGAV